MIVRKLILPGVLLGLSSLYPLFTADRCREGEEEIAFTRALRRRDDTLQNW